MKKQSPIGRILELGERERGKLIMSVILAVVGVICGMVPYYAAAQIMVRLLAGQNAFAAYVPWLMATLIGFLLRTVLYNGALGISHTATFAIPKTIRQKIIEKTAPFAARNGRGYAKRHAQGYHRRPCGQHENDPCATCFPK